MKLIILLHFSSLNFKPFKPSNPKPFKLFKPETVRCCHDVAGMFYILYGRDVGVTPMYRTYHVPIKERNIYVSSAYDSGMSTRYVRHHENIMVLLWSSFECQQESEFAFHFNN